MPATTFQDGNKKASVRALHSNCTPRSQACLQHKTGFLWHKLSSQAFKHVSARGCFKSTNSV